MAKSETQIMIRVLTPADAKAYRALRLEALRLEPAAFASSAEEFENEPLELVAQRFQAEAWGAFTLGAFRHESLVGIVTFFPETRLKVDHKANLFGMYVTPAEQGKGIARMLLQAFIKRAKSYPKIKQVKLSVMTTQQAAKQLYLSLGFEVYGLEPNALKLAETFIDAEDMILFL